MAQRTKSGPKPVPEPVQRPLEQWEPQQIAAAKAEFFEAVRKLRAFEEDWSTKRRKASEKRGQLRGNVDDLMRAIEEQGA